MISFIKKQNLLLIYPFFILLFICTQILSPKNKLSAADKNHDGKTDDITQLIEKQSATLSTLDTNMVIGMIKTASYQAPLDRLNKLGYHHINLLSATSGLDSFLINDIIILPVCWADSGEGAADTILLNSEDYKQYVMMGGGLFIEQPNPNRQPGDSIIVTLLPEPVTFHRDYNPNDYPMTIVDTTHVITNGLSGSDMPFPADSIAELDTMYHILVRGGITGIPSLFVAEYGYGKILVHTAHSSPTSTHPMSDTVYVRMINWVKSEIINSIYDQNYYHPEQIKLSQNYPNPFNPVTTIEYLLSNSGYVTLKIYDLVGREISTLVDQYQAVGIHTIDFDGTNLSSGVYFYRLVIGKSTEPNSAEIKKMVLIR